MEDLVSASLIYISFHLGEISSSTVTGYILLILLEQYKKKRNVKEKKKLQNTKKNLDEVMFLLKNGTYIYVYVFVLLSYMTTRTLTLIYLF